MVVGGYCADCGARVTAKPQADLPMVEVKECLMWRIAARAAAVFACLICVSVVAALFILRQYYHEESGKFTYQMQDSTGACSADVAVQLIDCI